MDHQKVAAEVTWPLPNTVRKGEESLGCQAGVRVLLAGIELVEIAGVAELDEAQIRADAAAFRAVGIDGLVLSWDLWVMPLERLELLRV